MPTHHLYQSLQPLAPHTELRRSQSHPVNTQIRHPPTSAQSTTPNTPSHIVQRLRQRQTETLSAPPSHPKPLPGRCLHQLRHLKPHISNLQPRPQAHHDLRGCGLKKSHCLLPRAPPRSPLIPRHIHTVSPRTRIFSPHSALRQRSRVHFPRIQTHLRPGRNYPHHKHTSPTTRKHPRRTCKSNPPQRCPSLPMSL